MSYSIHANAYILNYTSKDYAENVPEGEIKVDCSLGVNADLLGNCIFDRLHEFSQRTEFRRGDYEDIKFYPHNEGLKNALAGWYQRNGVGEGWLTADHFLLGNGSYDILCNLNLLCLTNGRKVLGHAPQFTAYIDHVHCSGSGYDCYYLDKKQNYRFEAEGYLAKMSDAYDMFIVENPNNPTGQIIPIEDLRRIAARALELDRVLVIDEAYGEYMPFENTAIHLIKEFPQVIVTRSFSKGWGMAGVRLGYAAASTESDLLPQLKKLALPFNSNGIGRVLAQTALETKLENPDDPFGIHAVRASKREFCETVEECNRKYDAHLSVAKTYRDTPILTLYYDGPKDIHLQQHLMRVGIMAVSCETYEGLDKRAVRIMLPERSTMPLLLELLEEAAKLLTTPEQAMKMFQEEMAGEAERAGLHSDEDVANLVKEVRSKTSESDD